MGDGCQFSIHRVSQGVEKSTGMPESHFLGRKLEDLYLLEEPGSWARHLDHCKANLQIDDFSFWVSKPDGERQFLAVNAKPVFGPDGKFVG